MKKKLWKQYWRYIRMQNRAKWYLDNIQPLSLSMNQEYARYKQLANELKIQLWENSPNN